MIYCHGDKSYPCLVGIGLRKSSAHSTQTELNLAVGMDCNKGMVGPGGKVDLFLENPNCNLIRVASLQATRQPLCRREMHCAVCNAHEGPSRQ